MTRDEEIALKQHLEHVLRQVQYSLKVMGLQPVELCDVEVVQPYSSRSGAATGALPSVAKRSGSELRRIAQWRSLESSVCKRSDLEPRRIPRRSLEAELEDMELKNKELIAAFEKLTSEMKLKVAIALDNKHVTPEFALEVDQLVECFNKNVQKAMQAGGGLLTLRGLLRSINMYDKLNTLRENADTLGSAALFAVTVIDRVVENVGTSPVQFHSIGKEAECVLNTDFTFVLWSGWRVWGWTQY